MSEETKTTQEIPVATPLFSSAADERAWIEFAAAAATRPGTFALEAARYADVLLGECKRRRAPAVFFEPQTEGEERTR